MKNFGVTTIELIAVLAIASILIGIVAPSIINIHNRSKATAEVNWIIGAINYSRHSAIIRRTNITLCPYVKNSRECNGKWHEGLIAFTDYNQNARLDGEDFLIEKIQNTIKDGTITWRAFRNRQYLQFTPYGYTNFQNGNFTHCPKNGDPQYARQIVINTQGRARVINSRDAAGQPIDRRGKALRC